MKVLHVPFHYFPETAGRTEMYAAALAEPSGALERQMFG
jgi:hypothetical protein